MSLAQQLLLRALVAWFWREPQRRRAGALGHGAARPLHARRISSGRISSTCSTISRHAGYAVRSGLVRRAARIPLPVLRRGRARRRASSSCGRRSSPGTCWARRARPAAPRASSIPRSSGCRSRSRGSTPARHVVACNGRARAAALRPAARASTSPACASRPGSCRRRCTRRSTVHAPLTFDIFDTWNGRSLGGCVYHVAHPGGRNYETFPVNSYEARGAAAGALRERGHTPGPFSVPAEERSLEYPMTLDLRRPTQI